MLEINLQTLPALFYATQGQETFHSTVPGAPDIKAIAEGSNKPFTKKIPVAKKLHPKTLILSDWSLAPGILRYDIKIEIINTLQKLLKQGFKIYISVDKSHYGCDLKELHDSKDFFDEFDELTQHMECSSKSNILAKTKGLNLTADQVEILDYISIRSLIQELSISSQDYFKRFPDYSQYHALLQAHKNTNIIKSTDLIGLRFFYPKEYEKILLHGATCTVLTLADKELRDYGHETIGNGTFWCSKNNKTAGNKTFGPSLEGDNNSKVTTLKIDDNKTLLEKIALLPYVKILRLGSGVIINEYIDVPQLEELYLDTINEDAEQLLTNILKSRSKKRKLQVLIEDCDCSSEEIQFLQQKYPAIQVQRRESLFKFQPTPNQNKSPAISTTIHPDISKASGSNADLFRCPKYFEKYPVNLYRDKLYKLAENGVDLELVTDNDADIIVKKTVTTAPSASTSEECTDKGTFYCTGECDKWFALPSLDAEEIVSNVVNGSGANFEIGYSQKTKRHYIRFPSISNSAPLPQKIKVTFNVNFSSKRIIYNDAIFKSKISDIVLNLNEFCCLATMDNKSNYGALLGRLKENLKTYTEDEVVTALQWFLTYEFKGGEIPKFGPNADNLDRLMAILNNKKGVCRQRAHVFMVIAKALGIEARYNTNDCHALCERFNKQTGKWEQIDCGGVPAKIKEFVPNESKCAQSIGAVNQPEPIPTPIPVLKRINECEVDSKYVKYWKYPQLEVKATLLESLAGLTAPKLTAQSTQDHKNDRKVLLIIDPKQRVEITENLLIHLRNNNEEVFYLDNFDDILSYINSFSTKDLKPIQNGKLREFLTVNSGKPKRLVIDAGKLISFQITTLQSTLDKNPTLFGIIFDNKKINVTWLCANTQIFGPDFYSRFRRIFDLTNLIVLKKPVEPNKPDEEKVKQLAQLALIPHELQHKLLAGNVNGDVVVNFYEDPSYKKYLVGTYALTPDKEDMVAKVDGLLILASQGKLKSLTIVNPPKTEEFALFLMKIRQEKRVLWHSEYYVLPDDFMLNVVTDVPYNIEQYNNTFKTQEPGKKFNYALNTETFDIFFHNYKIINGKIIPLTGFLERHRGQTLSILVTSDLPENYRALFFAEAKRCECKVEYVVADGVQINSKLFSPSNNEVKSTTSHHKNVVVVTNDIDHAEKLLRKEEKVEPIVISISETTTLNELFFKTSIDADKKTHHEPTLLWIALAGGAHVILKGPVSEALLLQAEGIFRPEIDSGLYDNDVWQKPEGRITIITASPLPQGFPCQKLVVESAKPIVVAPIPADDLETNSSQEFISHRVGKILERLGSANFVSIVDPYQTFDQVLTEKLAEKCDISYSIKDWLKKSQRNSGRDNVLIVNSFDELKGIFNNPPGILIDGQYHPLTAHDKIVLVCQSVPADLANKQQIILGKLPDYYLRYMLDTLFNSSEIEEQQKNIIIRRAIEKYRVIPHLSAKMLRLEVLREITKSAIELPSSTKFIATSSRTEIIKELLFSLEVRKLKASNPQLHSEANFLGLTGPSGIGKSQLVINLLKESNDFIRINADNTNVDELIEKITAAYINGKILLIDEVNLLKFKEENGSPSPVLLAIMAALNGTLSTEQKIKPGFLLIVTQNPAEEYGNRNQLPEELITMGRMFEVPNYTPQECEDILRSKLMGKLKKKNHSEEDAQRMLDNPISIALIREEAEKYHTAIKYALQNGHKPPVFRVFLQETLGNESLLQHIIATTSKQEISVEVAPHAPVTEILETAPTITATILPSVTTTISSNTTIPVEIPNNTQEPAENLVEQPTGYSAGID